MRIAFVGKGGSGKTTLAALFCRLLAGTGAPVLAIDADINQHLGAALGAIESTPPLADDLPFLKAYVRGENRRITSLDSFVKTTPPGTGSRLMRFDGSNRVFDRFVESTGSTRLIRAGAFDEADLGVRCFHSKTGAVEIFLNHLIDGPGEYVVVDMTAGADAFASGLCAKFDLTVLVVEPTLKSVGVCRQYRDYASRFGLKLAAIGNKIESDADRAFIREHVGTDLIGAFARSSYVRASERGETLPLEALEPENREVLIAIRAALDACERDWGAYLDQTYAFHRRNAESWANAATGEDLALQIDPSFSYPYQRSLT